MGEPETSPAPAMRAHVAGARPSPRAAEDDFFCLRYEVWYPSVDCAWRTKFQTCPGCANCEQGRFNLKRHERALAGRRFPLQRD